MHTRYEIEFKIVNQMLLQALKKKKDEFVVQVEDWRGDMIKFNRLLTLNRKNGKKAPPEPYRPVWTPMLKWSGKNSILGLIELAVAAEEKMRALAS